MSEEIIIKNLEKYIVVENTRMFFDFMKELDECILNDEKIKHKDKIYNGVGGLKQRFEDIEKLSNSTKYILNNCFNGNGILEQNSISRHISFWNKYFSKNQIVRTNSAPVHNTIANMLRYYRCITQLNETIVSNDDMPYVYEDICLSICGMTNADTCYILLRSPNAVTVLSGADRINSSIPNGIIKHIEQNELTDEALVDGVYYSEISTDDKDAQINNLQEIVVSEENKNNVKQKYIIISLTDNLGDLQPENEFFIIINVDRNSIEYNLKLAASILFMRERLIQAITRDYALLMKLKSEYEYIKPIGKITDPIKILHTSDWHLTQNKHWSVNSKSIRKIITKMERKRGIDLLAVTGDIINGASNAIEAQERYKLSENVLLEFAKHLWGYKDNDKYWMPHDWKKRILITTGNHDYSAMNDVIVETKSRVIKSAVPSNGNGGTMSKFTYLLEFLNRFLDAPIEKYIDNNLNELRQYRNLNLNVLILNTVSYANSLQNNKVGFDKDSVMNIISNINNYSLNTIVLSHHDPNYEIDYVTDIYEPYNLFKQGENDFLDELYTAFNDLIKNTDDSVNNISNIKEDYIFPLQNKLSVFKNKIEDYQLNESSSSSIYELKKIVRRFKHLKANDEITATDIDNWIKTFCESDLFFDIKNLCEYKEKIINNEFSLGLLNKLKTIKKMQDCDKKTFHNNCEEIYSKTNNVVAYLSGHIHESKEDTYKRATVYISNKLLSEMKIINVYRSAQTKSTLIKN